MKRTPLRSRPRRRTVGLDGASEEREAWLHDLGWCIVCHAEGLSCSGPIQGHHAVAAQTLKRHGLHRFLWDRRNRVPVCEGRHARHTIGFRPIPRSALPAAVFEFGDEVGLTWWLDKHYPIDRRATA